MNETTDAPPPSAAGGPAPRKPAAAGKPRFALFVATACGPGYLPTAPGTWGSLAGLVLVTALALAPFGYGDFRFDPFLFAHCVFFLVTCAVGVWSAGRAARFWQVKDPQRVVIDEVSGQYLAILLGCALPVSLDAHIIKWSPLGLITFYSALSWKYLLLGLILFRLFDIWKPFPARQAESLPGGWGIMADDWVAGVYAAIGLWIARAAGL
jgi:phosphatidylglycerophosphatase A